MTNKKKYAMNPIWIRSHFVVFAKGSHPHAAPITIGGNRRIFNHNGQLSRSIMSQR
jgi:hypothetical protein